MSTVLMRKSAALWSPRNATIDRCSSPAYTSYESNPSLMPCISRFYGISVYLYYRDHAPPHVHAIYGEHEAEIDIATATISHGSLPTKARSLVAEWAAAHRDELQQNWDLARAGQPLNDIDPLQ